MKISLSAICGAVVYAVSDNFGIDFVDCEEYFRSGAEWILQDQFPDSVRLCQNRNFEPHKYATLFDVKTRTPIYSAGRFMRDPNAEQNGRPNSNWHHLALGLCLDSDYDLKSISKRSFYSNIDSVSSKNYDFCSTFQALDDDYKGNTGDLNIDRGHLLPNGIANHDESFQKATFTLTNICPQYSTFNQQAWNQLECMVRKYLEVETPREYVHIITGTWGTKLTMNEDNQEKNEVRLPEYYWKAFCYDNNGQTYSWVYVQINEPDQKLSSGDLFMPVSLFSQEFYDGADIFDDKCQHAGFGPWLPIMEDWEVARKRYGC